MKKYKNRVEWHEIDVHMCGPPLSCQEVDLHVLPSSLLCLQIKIHSFIFEKSHHLTLRKFENRGEMLMYFLW